MDRAPLLDRAAQSVIGRIEELIGLILAVMVVLVFGNVVLLFIWLTFLGAVVAVHQHERLGVDTLVQALPRKGKVACVVASELLGGFAVTGFVLGSAAVDPSVLSDAAGELAQDPRVIGAQLWRPAQGPASAGSSEAKLRPGGDRGIAAALVLDVMREREAREMEGAAALALRRGLRAEAERDAPAIRTGVYRLLGIWNAAHEVSPT